jgi:hypothetical protein
MQLLQPSLLSYLQRFNHKRRLNYKIDLLPRLGTESASAWIKQPVKLPSRVAREPCGINSKARAMQMGLPRQQRIFTENNEGNRDPDLSF